MFLVAYLGTEIPHQAGAPCGQKEKKKKRKKEGGLVAGRAKIGSSVYSRDDDDFLEVAY